MDDVSRTANIITQFLEFVGGENSEGDRLVNRFNCRPTRKSEVGPSRTLISRRRRGRPMKNKLNSLRSLVPDIAKMEEASITMDEVIFLQELITQAKKLKAEIAAIDASLPGPESPDYRAHEPNISNNRETPQEINNLVVLTCHQKIVTQLEVFQVEDKEFCIRLVCVKAARIAATLYKALESLTGFTVQSSNLSSTTSGDRYVFTFTVKVDETDPDMNLACLELCVIRAFLSQGFELPPKGKKLNSNF